MPKKINPIIEALDGLSENTAIAAAPQKRKMKTPLKIVIISVAAVMLLGTTAAAATLGEHPIVKLNGKTVTPRFSSYVDDNGWKIDTTVIEYPVDQTPGYSPAGEVRGVYDENAEYHPDSVKYFDELGVQLDEITDHLRISFKAEKEGEIDLITMKIGDYPNYHHSESGDRFNNEVKIELWQDPIQIAMDALGEKVWARMSLDEKVNHYLYEYYDYSLPDYGGFAHPSLKEILTEDARGYNPFNFKGLPSVIAGKYYDYVLDQPEGFTEKEGLQIIQFTNDIYTEVEFAENAHAGQLDKADDPMIIQQIFIYTLTDNASGKDVKFTVWRSAEEKDVDTSCFKFDYEYIPLKNGTEARLHQSVDYNYIVEFEKDGAAYAAVTDLDMELVERVLKNMNLL